MQLWGLPWCLSGKESAGNADVGLIAGSGRCPGEANGNPLKFLPGKSHEPRSLVGYSPWGHKRVGHDLVTKQQQQSIYSEPIQPGHLYSIRCSTHTKLLIPSVNQVSM